MGKVDVSIFSSLGFHPHTFSCDLVKAAKACGLVGKVVSIFSSFGFNPHTFSCDPVTAIQACGLVGKVVSVFSSLGFNPHTFSCDPITATVKFTRESGFSIISYASAAC